MGMGRRQFLGQAAFGASMGLIGKAKPAVAATNESAGEEFTFCVVADPHCSEPAKKGIERYGDGVAKFLACFEAMAKLEKPDFVLLAGDVHPGVLKGRLGDVSVPIHAVAGNHESGLKQRTELRELFPDDFSIDGKKSDYYSFVHKGVRFIAVCDAGAGGDHVGQMCSEVTAPRGQCEWLESELRKPEARKVVFAHIPPERNGGDVNMFMSRNDSRWFNALVGDTRPVAAFFGHLHGPTEEYAIGGTRCFNVRSCCWNFGDAPIGFLHVRVGTGGVEVREVTTGTYT